MALQREQKALPDSKIRHPQTLISLAARLSLIPPRERIIRVTGSKGKGPVSHFAARMIRASHPRLNVGLLISPHELIHRDRMRINGEIIAEDEFVALFTELEPHLQRIELGTLAHPYLSPSGLFLLLALLWFKRRHVDYFVIETGRGVRFDEAGNIPSHVAVITSILGEHLDKIGPTLADVAGDKLAITRSSTWVMTGGATRPFTSNHESTENLLYLEPPATVDDSLPRWIAMNHALALAAVKRLLPDAEIPVIPLTSPSFFTFAIDEMVCSAEGLIALDSLDRDYYDNFLAGARPSAVILSIPDDKELHQVTAFFTQKLGLTPYHVTISSPGLNYAQTRQHYGATTLCDLTNGPDPLLNAIRNHDTLRFARRVALLGTQSFLRIVKQISLARSLR